MYVLYKQRQQLHIVENIASLILSKKDIACVASVSESSRSSPLLHVGPCRQFLSELDVAPCPTRFSTFLGRSSEFVIFSGLVPGLLGVKFASLHDLYGASRSCHKVLDELIQEVLLSTLKPCINTKLQN
jgi:hypothetical protein